MQKREFRRVELFRDKKANYLLRHKAIRSFIHFSTRFLVLEKFPIIFEHKNAADSNATCNKTILFLLFSLNSTLSKILHRKFRSR